LETRSAAVGGLDPTLGKTCAGLNPALHLPDARQCDFRCLVTGIPLEIRRGTYIMLVFGGACFGDGALDAQ